MTQDIIWLIKYKNGRIRGPLSADEIVQLIVDKTICGEETIAVYPGGRWKPISVEPRFYESFLNVLSGTDDVKDSAHSTDFQSSRIDSSYSKASSTKTMVADISELKSIRKKRKKKNRERTIGSIRKKNSSEEKTLIYHGPEQESLLELDREELPYNVVGTAAGGGTVVRRKQEDRKRSFFGQNKRILIFVLVVFTVAFLLFQEGTEKMEKEYVILKKPGHKTGASLSKEQLDSLAKKAFSEYLHSTISSYMKSQTLWIQVIEGGGKDTYEMAMLCLVYLELWPFTRQDSKSINAISHLIHRTSLLNKGGVRSGMCHSVGLIIKGKYREAKTMVESALEALSPNRRVQDPKPRIMISLFYYLKARIMYYLNEHTGMISYLELIPSIHNVFSRWIEPYILAGDVLLKQQKVSKALSKYKKVVSLNPKHKTAKIKIGLIHYKHFNQMEKAENILKIALSYPDMISHQILSDAYFGLAEINLKKKRTAEALKYARQAYSYNPANLASQNLVVQIGGLGKLKETQVKSNQLVYEGDQLMLNNKFRAAIGYYEEAFKVDDEKNAVVAVKTAKSYWALSFSDQAIKWLKKAINADSTIMEAYVLLAEYYSEQYDFYNAKKVLEMASRKAQRSYELYRGKAYLALKKREYKRVTQYAKRALSIYDADVESYVILSKAYTKMGDLNEALAFATRGLEVDPNSVKAHIAYARALGAVYGMDTGVGYFQKMVTNYPMVMEYKREWMKYLFDDEQYSKAKEKVLQIISIEPKSHEAYFYLGRISMVEGDFLKAYEAFLQAAILAPSNPKSTFYIGLLRIKEKKYSMAKTQFLKVLALNKLYPKARYYLGKIAFLTRDYKTAIKQARLETRSNPNLVISYLLAGESYEKQKQFLNCAREYQKAIELVPEDMQFYVRTARCYRQSGHLDLALKILKEAKGGPGLKSGNPLLYREMGVIYEIQGSHQEAAGSYCKYLNLMPRAPDRRDVEQRMQQLSKLTGKAIRNCG